MASLYIKNSDTADLAEEVAAMLGTSKTAAVHDALLKLRGELAKRTQPTIHERMEQWRRDHPLGEPTGLEADKAFYDSLYEDDDD